MPIRALGSDWKRLWAARQRSHGRYTRDTLAAYFAAWCQRPTATNLLAWLAFRRDMGWPVPMRHVSSLRGALPQLDAPRRRLAVGLLAETGTDALAELDVQWLSDAAGSLPAVAGQLGTASELAQLALRQGDWQRAFASAFTAAALNGGVQVVGNAAYLLGQQLGERLDSAAWVIRFNQFANGPEWHADVGQRLDVWVVSPGYTGPVPDAVSWVVLSGPDLQFRLQDWTLIKHFLRRGTPVLTVPLPVWRWCVRTLHAPPSAGVLILHWLHSLNGLRQWNGLRAAGIGFGVADQSQPYHLALPQHKPGHRHAWEAEALLVEAWKSEGLCTADKPLIEGVMGGRASNA